MSKPIEWVLLSVPVLPTASNVVLFFFFSFFFLFPFESLQNTGVASAASRMPVPVSAKSRQPPGGTEKAGKQQKLQDPQRQFRQVVLL